MEFLVKQLYTWSTNNDGEEKQKETKNCKEKYVG
jgi:hypothetical protein